MIHLGLQSFDLLKLRSTIRHEGVWMFLGVSGPWLSAWLPEARFKARLAAYLRPMTPLSGSAERFREATNRRSRLLKL